jgi:hypothetical protein
MVSLLFNGTSHYAVYIQASWVDVVVISEDDNAVSCLTQLLFTTEKPKISPFAAINYFPESDLTPKKVSEILGALYDKQVAQDWISINIALSRLDPNLAADTAIIAVLRGTYAARGFLKEWKPAVERAITAFDGRGRTGHRLLRGLL